MDAELLRCLLAAFPADDFLVIDGYRVPFDIPVDDVLLSALAARRNGHTETLTGFDRG